MIHLLQGGLQKIFDQLGIEEDGTWDTEALTHKRGSVLYRLGMLEYRAFELTQTNLAILASQHRPNQGTISSKDRFEAPDLLLPSLQKPVPAAASASKQHISTVDTEVETGDGDGMEDDYGEEYDDTRTFTVKDFKEQALRYAKDHFHSHSGAAGASINAKTGGDPHGNGASPSLEAGAHSVSSNPFKSQIAH